MNSGTPGTSAVVNVLKAAPPPPGMNWTPVHGEQALALAARSGLDGEASSALLISAAQILGSGVNPKGAPGRQTGLVVGYVQSGKTLSFTTVIALARDNGFPLVIVVAGNKTSLLAQSHARLAHDLDVGGGDGLPAWIMAQNPKAQDSQYEQFLRRAIENWRDQSLEPDEKPTFLLTVLKQNQRLSSLTSLLKRLNLVGVPALVIDDEADQASLNSKVNQGQESTTYSRLLALRDALPCHTFLQYTATPQAPLLINIADTLSPNFVRVLEPGSGYVGGETFFSKPSKYVETIPALDVAALNAGQPDPPDSLLTALRIYFIGLAASIIEKTGRRSMLIHPAREKVVHQESATWAAAAKAEWEAALKLPASDPDRADVLEIFATTYAQVKKTAPSLPSFEQMIERLPRALRNTTVIEFNTRGQPKTPEIEWRNSEGWILVGGQAVDRGFTVESLSVTYMPRGIGVGNADALQQRARFFGYKRKYIGICRVFLEQDLRDAFEGYVEHEQMMRTELKRLSATGENLRTWRRRLVLDPSLQPCRASVISDPLSRQRRLGGWTQQRGAMLTPDAMASNTSVLAKLAEGLTFEPDTTYVSNLPAQQHLVSRDVPLSRVLDALVEYRCEDARDTASFTGLLVTLGEVLRNNKDAKAAVYKMRPLAKADRTIADDGSIENFQQGPTASGNAYPGDSVFKASDRLSVHLNYFDLKQEDKKVVATAAPLLAFHVPPALAKSWLVQVQAGQP